MGSPLRKQFLLLAQIAVNTVVGYLFLRLLALKFGVTAQKDGFDIAYSVPFIVLNLSGFAFLHAVIATQFAKTLAVAPHKLESVFSTTLTAMLAVCAVLLVSCTLGAKQVIAVLGPGLSAEVAEQARWLMVWMLPLVLTLGLSAYFSAVLTAYGVPVTAEFCQILSRLGVAGCLAWIGMDFRLEHVAIGLVCGSIVGLTVTWWILARTTTLKYRAQLRFSDPDMQLLFWQGGSFFLAALAAQLSAAYMRRLATLDGVGTNAMLTYALGLVAPLSIIVGKPISLAMGPAYVGLFASGQTLAARKMLLATTTLSVLLAAPVSVLLSVFAVPIVRLLYAGGSFDHHAVTMTAELCRGVVWSLPATTVLWVVLMPLLGTQRPIVPALIYVAGYLAQIGVTAVLFPVFSKTALVAGYLVAVHVQVFLSVAVVARHWLATHKAVSHQPQLADDYLKTAASRRLIKPPRAATLRTTIITTRVED